MNIFTDHDYGHFADDGFGNLSRLTREQIYIALLFCVGYESALEYYND